MIVSDQFFTEIEKEYYLKLVAFYMSFFPDEKETKTFIDRMYTVDPENRIPRQMILQVERFVTLAEDIEKIRPARDGLRIVFIKACMESLVYLGKDDKTAFFSKLASCFSEEGKNYILSHFRLTGFEQTCHDTTYWDSYDLTMDDFLRVIKAVRDRTIHDGVYWETQFFAKDDDSIWVTTLNTCDKILSGYQYSKKERIEYTFETTLQFSRFKHYFVEACINYIAKYVDDIASFDFRLSPDP